jgi:predicted deacylase
MTTYKSSEASCDFDFDAQGKNFGALRLANADARLGNRVPIATIVNGSGPTVLLCAGSHGNEDEGQLILRRLIHKLEPSDVQGRIIFMPALNYPAVRACTRTSPLDGGNLNRSFPGDGASGPTSAIARFVVDALLPLADAGMDLHSAAYNDTYVDTTFLCTCADNALYRKSLELADAFQAPYMYVVNNIANTRNFDSAAHAQNVQFVSAELGGGGINQKTISIGYRGIRNVLAHLDVIAAAPNPSAPQSTVYLDAGGRSSGVQAPYEGLFEARFDIGDEVAAGQVAGVLYSLDEVDRPPRELLFTEPGIVFVKSVSARVFPGSGICKTAKAVTHDDILALGDARK